MLNQVQIFVVSQDEEGQRLDNYMLARLKGVPKSAIYRIIRKGEVRINKGRAKPDRRLVPGDQVRIPPIRTSQPSQLAVPSQSLMHYLQSAILYDHEGLLIVNKPAGLAVHGGSGVDLGMIEALRQMPEYHGFLELVHRLDRDTSGCIMIARKRSVLKKYQEALRQREGIHKTYLALVQGHWPQSLTRIDAPLLRTETKTGERFVKVHPEGKPSLTQFEVEQYFRQVTLVKASPITGRTHQIRVHAKHAGFPLVGDEKYGDTTLNVRLGEKGIKRLFLHAESLKIELPNEPSLHVQAPLPKELQLILKQLEN